MSFAARLTFYILTLVFIIFGCIAIVFLSYNKQREQQQAMQYTSVLQQNVIQKIDSELSDVETAIKIAAGQVDDMAQMPDSIMNIARTVIKSNKLVKGVGIAFRPGYYPQKGRLFMEYIYKWSDNNLWYKHYNRGVGDYTERSWYKRGISGESDFWTEPYVDNDNKSDFMVSYVHACTDTKGNVYGVIFADVTLNDLTASIKNLRPYPNSYSFVLSNKTGKYVSHPVEELILATNYSVRAKLIDCPELNTVGKEMVSGKTDALRTNIEGKDVVLCYATMKRTGWSVCSVNLYSDIMASLGSPTLYIFAILIVGLIMLSVCIRLLVKYTSKPIRELTEAAYQIARGDFNAKLPEVETKDDLKQLHDAFANMQHSLKKYIKELKITTSAKEHIESELSIAHSIQMSLVPKIFSPFPDCKQLDLYAYLKPAKEVGGDFYDFFLSNGKLFFVIGDVSGKGIPASLVMAITRTLFRIISATTHSPADIVEKLNDAIAKDNDTNMFVTMFAGVLDYVTGEMVVCNAGHNKPLLINRNDNSIHFFDAEQNLPLGVLEGYKFEEQTITMKKGDGILLYTDGLTEAENIKKELFGDDRTEKVLAQCTKLQAKDVIKKINAELATFVGEAEQSDDLTMLCFYLYNVVTNYEKSENMNARELTMSNNIEDSKMLYPFISEIGEKLGIDDSTLNSINLAIEEATVNSIMYAYSDGEKGDVTLKAEWTEDKKTLKFILQDSGVAFNPLNMPDADTSLDVEERPIGGLGIFLVKQIMDNVEYQRNGDKNVLTMTKNL